MNKTNHQQGHILIYQSEDGHPSIDVRLEDETVWLTLNQMADLFRVDKSGISRHVKNIYKTGELTEDSTVAKIATVQEEGNRKVTRKLEHYNLDMILSVGYRVTSQIATRFRIWATQTLKQHLVQGYTLNRKRLESFGTDVEHLVDLVRKTLKSHELVESESLYLTKIIADYARSWTLLQAYDEQTLEEPDLNPDSPQILSEKEAISAIQNLKSELMNRGEATELFGLIRTEGLNSSLGAIEQTFGGEPLYPTIVSRAAHLLYFIIKNHPFTDGNKRIGSFLFLLYLEKNKISSRPGGTPKISDNAIIPLALLIAESDPKQKDLIIRLVQHLLLDES